ncbi:phosphatase [candidate division WOR-1 bacterium RIFOXYB2_FULL_42_35]|uniref:Phosphatase n=1 Tax=candidate division WOR-1 bacterium RIFOXYC2_FULL_41_25 TaxID=1802586 RepID=A0A1F4TMF5_UNCSA|nr:MAG: phosphatase [candidate division WOR-1 bacterium RIFOXYB2_FULL_42_35]OGC25587.1 MAG: phosphatase [candidate division WOR-1 bacterium RIFOXYA2_FULL_41_14]OGC33253.1 MAG: phosphatase [candidate division WOR-1 bacterium RIFOXYC2_FULL_41_25]OGC41372.1 MAG: phosphatase [candidate division WOR-1 bacterium RIFOXYD2_FULL_41_8]
MINQNKIKRIKAVVMDVDGVLTDGTFFWDSGTLELKRFCFADRTGIPLAQKAGLIIALMSGESSEAGMAIVDRYAQKLNITAVYKGCRDKGKAIKEFAQKQQLKLAETCFMGDDINDIPAIKLAGFSAAPADANPAVLKTVDLVTKRTGGHGAVRELLDLILEKK